jgi:predicted cupin superfamily sugar epimerase
MEDDAPTSVWFRFEGLKCKAQLDDRDEDFVQLAMGFALREESRDELTLLRAMNEVQASTKVVKVYVSPALDFVEFEMELFLDGRPPTLRLLERCLQTLRVASREYFSKVRPDTPAAQA